MHHHEKYTKASIELIQLLILAINYTVLSDTVNPRYKAPLGWRPFLNSPRFAAHHQYIRSHLMNKSFCCKICNFEFFAKYLQKVSDCLLMYLTMPFLDKVFLWNVNFVAFWRSQSSHLPRLRVPLDTGRLFLGCPVRGFYCINTMQPHFINSILLRWA